MSKQYKLIRCNINGKDVEKMVRSRQPDRYAPQ